MVNDQNRIVKVVDENRNAERNTFSTNVKNDTIPEQQRFTNSTKHDYLGGTQERMTVPVIARAATSSFITTGGIVGIRSPQNDSRGTFPFSSPSGAGGGVFGKK